jgi:hypothetical protein
MNKSVVDIIREQNSKYRRFLILNDNTYNILKRELGMEEYEELVEFKNLIICISKNDLINILVI